MANTSLIRSASLTGFGELCRSLGLDPLRLLAATGIPRAALRDPDLKIDSRAVGELLDLAAVRSKTPTFGLRLAETRRLSNLGPVALIIRDQPSLRKALEILGHHLWLHNEALTLGLDENEDLAIARVELAAPGRRASPQAVELAVGVLVGNLRTLLGARWRAEAVLFRHAAPEDLSVHRRVFGRTPEFSHNVDGLVFPRMDLDVPLANADPIMARQIERHLAQAWEARERSARDAVGEIIVLLLPTGGCTADRVAAHMGVDRRTIHRRLAAEDATFRTLLDEKRAELASSLIQGARSIASIADQCGFSSPSAFTHWFTRRFGRPPRAHRATLGSP